MGSNLKRSTVNGKQLMLQEKIVNFSFCGFIFIILMNSMDSINNESGLCAAKNMLGSHILGVSFWL